MLHIYNISSLRVKDSKANWSKISSKRAEASNFITVIRVGRNNIICFLEAFTVSASLIIRAGVENFSS